MSKTKAPLGMIPDARLRQSTYCKRRKGLIKKAMELSKMCGASVYFFISDSKTDHVFQYQTSADRSLKDFLEQGRSRTFLFDTDYEKLCKQGV